MEPTEPGGQRYAKYVIEAYSWQALGFQGHFSFLRAITWDEMVGALVAQEDPDFLVILCQADAEEPIRPLPTARCITFCNDNELRGKLSDPVSLSQMVQPIPEVLNHEDEGADDVALQSSAVGEQPSSNLDRGVEQSTRNITAEDKASRTDAEITAAVIAIQRWYRRRISQRKLELSGLHKPVLHCSRDVRNINLGHCQARTDAEATAAVIIIQRWYRQHVSQRKLESSGFHKLVLDCNRAVKTFNSGHHQASAHRWQFAAIRRGPLPHVLFVLSSISTLIRSRKNDAKRRLATIGPGDECKDDTTKLK